jgi:HAD superfamily hydrolase (TIGR01484 family)
VRGKGKVATPDLHQFSLKKSDLHGMSDIRLLVIDLDGTLVGPTDQYFVCLEFKDKINQFLSRTGAKWAICTGRSMEGYKTHFKSMLKMGIRPDYVVTRDAYIFTVTPKGLMIPHLKWNFSIFRKIFYHNASVNDTLGEWHALCSKWDFGISKKDWTTRSLILHFNSEDAAIRVFEMLNSSAEHKPHVRVRHLQNVVWAESRIVSKGLAVNKLAQITGVRADQILAVGDGRNDLSMMSPDVAKMTGCPRNAKPEVIELVAKNGGHIAKSRNLEGTIEVLDAYLTGRVCSDLPPLWAPPGLPSGDRSASGKQFRTKRYAFAFLIMGAVLAALVLIIFSYFGLVSFFRR